MACMVRSISIFRMILLRGLHPYKDVDIQFMGIRPGEKLHEQLFHGAEKPLDTLHPNIFRVHSGQHPISRAAFEEVVQLVGGEGAVNPTEIKRKLLQLIVMEQIYVQHKA